MCGQEFVFTLLRKAVAVLTRFFCLSIYPVRCGLINPSQFLFSFAHMNISIEKKKRVGEQGKERIRLVLFHTS